MKKNILITGATGLLGSRLLKIILQEENSTIYLFLRDKNKNDVQQRLLILVKKILGSKYNKGLLRRIRIIKGDLEDVCIFRKQEIFNNLYQEIQEIYHCAATLNFRITLRQARKINVRGTKKILEFAKRCPRLDRFNYISTAFIIGKKEAVFKENGVVFFNQKFNNAYEQSKFEAENLVKSYKKDGLPISIFRPSIITGDYLTGETSNFHLIYEPLRFFALRLFSLVPADIHSLHNLIPADVAARAIYLLSRNEDSGKIYHIVSPNNDSFGNFMKEASIFFGFKNPEFIPLERFNMKILSPVQKKIIAPFIPYLNYRGIFDSRKTAAILKKYNFKFPEIDINYYKRLFYYCRKVGFIK